MAVGPIQYLQPPKAFDLAQGLQIGGTIQGIRSNMAAQELAAQKQAQAEALKQQFQSQLSDALANPTAQKFASLTMNFPQAREAVAQGYKMVSDDQKKNELKLQGQVLNALKNNNIDVATNILDERIAATENAGGDATELKRIKTDMLRDPKGAMGSIMFNLSNVMDPDKFVETYGGVAEEQRKAELQPGDIKKQTAELSKFADELDLNKAKKNKILAETRKLDAETRKSLLELESKKGKEGQITDPKDLFKAEQDLRKEWTKRSADLSSANQNFNKIEISAKDGTGPGDIALITSFMKMLDPGSVVRETEFATAQNTAGLFDTLTNKLTKLQDGTLLGLDNKSRQKFVDLAKKYRDAAEKENVAVKRTFQNNIETYGMNPNNIFDVEPKLEDTAPAQPAPKTITVDY